MEQTTRVPLQEAEDSPSGNTRSKLSTNHAKNICSSTNLAGCSPKKDSNLSKANQTTGRTPVSSRSDSKGSAKSGSSKLSEIRAAALKKKREEMAKGALPMQQAIHDPDATAREAKYVIRGETGLIMNELMERHFNPWDKDHIERPERIKYIQERLSELGLSERCKQVMILAH